VFPQGKFHLESSDVHKNIRFVSNPSIFSACGIQFGVSSVDVLYHIKKEEYVKRGVEIEPVAISSPSESGNDPMTNLCRHFLQQRSFYPLFPTPLDVSHDVNLSVTNLDGLKIRDDIPDVLISPSRLKQFSKTVNSMIALNPGFLTKGTYGVLNVDPRRSYGQANGQISVEIAKLDP